MRERGLTILAVLLSFISTSAYAYTFTEDFSKGIYWGSFPILMNKFAVNVTEGDLLQRVVTESEQEWEDAVGMEIWNMPSVILGNGDGSGNFIRWSDNFAAETGYDPSATLAVTIRYSSGTYFSKVVILLNGQNQSLRQNFGGILRQTILHELGHTIGLGHSILNSIMYQSITNVRHLQHDDISGAIEAINEMQHKQAIGYIAPFTRDDGESERTLSCGTIEDNSSGGGYFGFIVSLFAGILLTFGSYPVRKYAFYSF